MPHRTSIAPERAPRGLWFSSGFGRTPGELIVRSVSEKHGMACAFGAAGVIKRRLSASGFVSSSAYQTVPMLGEAFLTSRCTGGRDTWAIWFLVNLQRAP